MASSESSVPLESFQTFGDLLKYLRRRACLTQRELAIAAGYSEGHISRLEQNQRPPDLAALTALFIPALYLEDEPEVVARLLELASQARGEGPLAGSMITFSHPIRREMVQTVEENLLHNLPLQLTSFIGRQAEIAHITQQLSGPNPARMLTLTGPGGIGKTRLALQAVIKLSHLYPHGIWFVDLAPLSSPELVLPTVASALSLAETRTQSIEESLLSYLRQKQILIVIDNCEHLVSATGQLAAKILRSCAHVQLLATSRELLNIPGEVIFQVPPLSLPDNREGDSQTPMAPEAVQLFVERARRVERALALTDANLSIIARICRQLDGMPLAIELAAARTSLLHLTQIETRLKGRFQLLSGGSATLPRHQTLRATIEWSHDLLSETEKALFRRLSVFAGGWTLDAGNFVCAGPSKDVLDLLAQLVNKSLVVVERQPDAQVRYRMLETIREYALEQLRASGEWESLRARHFDYFLQTARQGEPKLFSPESSIDWAEAEIDNLRAGLAWALEAEAGGATLEERTGRALDLIAHVWPLWINRGYSIEGNEWLNQLLAVHTAPTLARARALLLAGDFAGFRGDFARQTTIIQEALALARQLGDKKHIAWALMEMGVIERNRASPEAFEFLTESLAMWQALHEDLWVCRVSFLLAEAYVTSGNLEAARPLWKQGLDRSYAVNDRVHMGWGLEGLGTLERLQGHLERAGELYVQSLKLKAAVMDKTGIFYTLAEFARLAAAQKHFKRAVTLWGAAEQLGQTMNLVLLPSRAGADKATFVETRTRLGEKAFQAAWNRGTSMTLHEAVEYALAQART